MLLFMEFVRLSINNCMDEQAKKNLRAFISNIATKDYSQAQKSLQTVVEDKIKARVNNCITKSTAGE